MSSTDILPWMHTSFNRTPEQWQEYANNLLAIWGWAKVPEEQVDWNDTTVEIRWKRSDTKETVIHSHTFVDRNLAIKFALDKVYAPGRVAILNNKSGWQLVIARTR